MLSSVVRATLLFRSNIQAIMNLVFFGASVGSSLSLVDVAADSTISLIQSILCARLVLDLGDLIELWIHVLFGANFRSCSTDVIDLMIRQFFGAKLYLSLADSTISLIQITFCARLVLDSGNVIELWIHMLFGASF
jgi:hypothetical protein